MTLHDIKNLYIVKEAVTRVKRQYTEWEVIFAMRLIEEKCLEYYKEVKKKKKGKKSTNGTKNPISKLANEVNSSEKIK